MRNLAEPTASLENIGTVSKKEQQQESREETKGRFRKRAVLANVLSFRFLVPGNIRMYPHSGLWYRGTSECTFVPVFVTGEHPPKARFWETTLLRTPKKDKFKEIEKQGKEHQGHCYGEEGRIEPCCYLARNNARLEQGMRPCLSLPFAQGCYSSFIRSLHPWLLFTALSQRIFPCVCSFASFSVFYSFHGILSIDLSQSRTHTHTLCLCLCLSLSLSLYVSVSVL